MDSKLLKAISGRVLLGDGAMGTQLQAAGLPVGACGDAWNLEHPDRVLSIQRAYVEAGSDCLITNTFNGCRIALERHGLADRVGDINRAGASIARWAFGSREGYVLGDIGPFGGFLEPLGDTTEATLRDAFQEQADALVAGGVDAIIIETQVALEELAVAIAAARRGGAPCIIASLSYDALNAAGGGGAGDELRTVMGVSPEQAAQFAVEAGADLIALNCGKGIDMPRAARCVERYRRACPLPTMAQPNGGSPELVDGRIVYRQTPQAMAGQLPQLLAAGANVVGACCGSTPDHIRAMRPIIDQHNARLAAQRPGR